MEQATPVEALTVKQRRFVEAYLGPANFNASKAARLAGYSERSAGELGYRWLKKVQIQAAISEGLSRLAMPAGEVLARLADHARGSLEDFVEVDKNGWRLNLEKAKDAGKLHLVKELSTTEHGPKIKLHDPQAALVQLGRYHKLWTDKQEVGGLNGEPLVVKVIRGVSMDDL